jgi:26S proteasome regulatory subunit N2
MLAEPAPSVRKAALRRLSAVVDTQWHEVAQSLPDLEAISEDTDEEMEVRQLAASIASRVFFYLEEPSQALRLALESGDGVFETSGSQSNKAFVECLVGAAVDAYIQKKGREHDGEDEKEEDAVSALSMEKLQAVVEFMFDRCYSEGKFEHALGIALEAQEIEKVRAVLDQCSQRCGGDKLYQVLKFSFAAATTLFISKAFRYQVIQVIAEQLELLSKDSSIADSTRKQCSFSLANAFQVLKDPKSVSTILCNLLDGTELESLFGLQICFDLVESGDQAFINGVAESLPTKGDQSGRSDDIWTRYEKARRVLTGGLTSELAISFLHKHSDSDPLIMENLKQGLESRGGGRNSTLHNCAVLTHSYLNAGTTNDAFLRDNLEWMKKASNW